MACGPHLSLVCTCMMCVPAGMHACECMCRPEEARSVLCHSPRYSLRQSLTEPRAHCGFCYTGSQQVLVILLYLPPGAGFVGPGGHDQIFTWCWGSELGSSSLLFSAFHTCIMCSRLPASHPCYYSPILLPTVMPFCFVTGFNLGHLCHQSRDDSLEPGGLSIGHTTQVGDF